MSVTSLFSFAVPSFIPPSAEPREESRKLHFTSTIDAVCPTQLLHEWTPPLCKMKGRAGRGTANRFHPQGKPTHAESILITLQTSVVMQRLTYPTETVLSNNIPRNIMVLSVKDSPRKPLGRDLSANNVQFRLAFLERSKA